MATGLKGKTAVVTGASHGIGRAVALALADKGMHLVLCARSAAQLGDVARAVTDKGVKALCQPIDVSHERNVAASAATVKKTFRRVDLLVNCAGQFLEKDFFKTTGADWDRIVGANLKGTYLCAREFGRLMADGKGGTIVNFSSVGGRIGLRNKAIYCASKFGVAGLSKALAKELKPHRIKVHTIYPYLVDTQGAVDWDAQPDTLNALKADDVAGLVVMLAKLPLRVEIEDIYLDTFLKQSDMAGAAGA